METIDLTPKWEGLLPVLLLLHEQRGEAKATAVEELQKMAKAADLYIASQEAEVIAARKRRERAIAGKGAVS